MAIFLLPTGNSRLIFGAPMVLINAGTGSYAILPTFISTDIWYYYKHSNQDISYYTDMVYSARFCSREDSNDPASCARRLLLRRAAPMLRLVPMLRRPHPSPPGAFSATHFDAKSKPPVLRYPLRHPYLPAVSRDPSVSIVGARQPALRCHGHHR